MYAVRLHAFGPPENLRYEEVDDPKPGPGQVRIAVAASGVHLIDTTLRAGRPAGPLPLPDLPAIPGREVAGVVDAIGPDVSPDWLGRRVVAHLGPASGGYASMAVAGEGSLHELPDPESYEAAVAMIGTGRTAMSVLDTAAIKSGDVVLVTGAAGGLGSLLVQAALLAGATVVGLAGGAAKTARVRGLGAIAVDYTDPEWPAAVTAALDGREVTVVLDGVGGDAGRAALELIGVGGLLVLFGWSSGAPTDVSVEDIYAKSLTVTAAIGPKLLRRPGGLRDLETRALAELAAGRLTPLVTTFTLADAAAAHRALENRQTVGKVVLTS